MTAFHIIVFLIVTFIFRIITDTLMADQLPEQHSNVCSTLASGWTLFVGILLVFGNVGATLSRNVAPLMLHDVAKALESS